MGLGELKQLALKLWWIFRCLSVRIWPLNKSQLQESPTEGRTYRIQIMSPVKYSLEIIFAKSDALDFQTDFWIFSANKSVMYH